MLLVIVMAIDVEGKGNGSGCRKSSQCDSGNCCGVWPFKKCRECCTDSDCSAGQNCRPRVGNRKCVASGSRTIGSKCVSDSDCTSKNCCGVPPFKRCRECCKDSDCPNGKNCKNRQCIEPRPNGRSCIPDSDCASGHCCGVWPFKRCRQCCEDSHCTTPPKSFCMRRECRVCLQEGQEGCDSDAECCGSSTCCGEGKINFKGDRFPKGRCIKATESCCVKMGGECLKGLPFINENKRCCKGLDCSGENDFTGTCDFQTVVIPNWNKESNPKHQVNPVSVKHG